MLPRKHWSLKIRGNINNSAHIDGVLDPLWEFMQTIPSIFVHDACELEVGFTTDQQIDMRKFEEVMSSISRNNSDMSFQFTYRAAIRYSHPTRINFKCGNFEYLSSQIVFNIPRIVTYP